VSQTATAVFKSQVARCAEGEGTRPLSELTVGRDTPKTAAILIGPEGGYEAEEAKAAEEAGLYMTGLGRRILRTETAAPFVLSCLSYQYEL